MLIQKLQGARIRKTLLTPRRLPLFYSKEGEITASPFLCLVKLLSQTDNDNTLNEENHAQCDKYSDDDCKEKQFMLL